MDQRSALSGEELEKAVQMKKDGASYPKIAEEFGISQSTAHKHVKRALSESESEGEEPAKGGGERTGESGESGYVEKRLTERGFKKAADLYQEGKSFPEIANKMNVSADLIESELGSYADVLDSFREIKRESREAKERAEEAIQSAELD